MNPFPNRDDFIPDITPDKEAVENLRNRMHRVRTDPVYRAQQRLRSQIGQSNSIAVRGKRNVAVSLPKFSWDN